MIRSAEIRLIDQDGKQVGVVPLQQAQDLAREKDLDLVEIKEFGEAESANPDVQGNRMNIVIAPNK